MGKPLKIKTAPNTFRVIFSEPMRANPHITFNGLPDGVSPNITKRWNTGFTVVFAPPATTVEADDFDITASAEL
jgi:hypothetical protein